MPILPYRYLRIVILHRAPRYAPNNFQTRSEDADAALEIFSRKAFLPAYNLAHATNNKDWTGADLNDL